MASCIKVKSLGTTEVYVGDKVRIQEGGTWVEIPNEVILQAADQIKSSVKEEK